VAGRSGGPGGRELVVRQNGSEDMATVRFCRGNLRRVIASKSRQEGTRGRQRVSNGKRWAARAVHAKTARRKRARREGAREPRIVSETRKTCATARVGDKSEV
jgi:hypothetical protein